MKEMSTLNGYEIIDRWARNKLGIDDGSSTPILAILNEDFEVVDRAARDEIESLDDLPDNSSNSLVDRSLTTYNNDEITDIGTYAFAGCNNLTSISCQSVESIDEYAFYYDRALQSVDFPSATSAEDCAFYNCDGLKTVNMPSVMTVGDQVFQYCESLTRISLPNLKNAGSGLLNYCKSLTEVDLPKLETTGSSSFYYCQSLKNLDLPMLTTGDTSLFYYCTSLENINLPKLTVIEGYAFYYCTSITELNLPSVTSIESRASDVFSNMMKLERVNLPELTQLYRLYNLFKNNTNLSFINMPKVQSVDTMQGSQNNFANCTSLLNISWPSLSYISSSTGLFTGANNLRRVDLGTVTGLYGSGLFTGVSNVKAIILRSETMLNPSSNSQISSWSFDPPGTCFVYVPANLVGEYRNTYGGDIYIDEYVPNLSRFRAIEEYPGICAVDWTPDKSPLYTFNVRNIYDGAYGKYSVLVDKFDDLREQLSIMPIIKSTWLVHGDKFVGIANSFDASSVDELLTSDYALDHDEELYFVFEANFTVSLYVRASVDTSEQLVMTVNPYYMSRYPTPGTAEESMTTLIYKYKPDPLEDIPGWTPLGWSLSTAHDILPVDADGNLSIRFIRSSSIGDVCLYGVYHRISTLNYVSTVFDSGSVHSQSVTDRYWTDGLTEHEGFTVAENGFIRNGYTFVGWALDSESGPVYQPGDIIRPDVDIEYKSTYTLYALWE